jgi:hypothetical protein
MLDMPVPKYVDSASTVSATPVPIVILGIVPSFAMDEDSGLFVFYNIRRKATRGAFPVEYVNFFPNVAFVRASPPENAAQDTLRILQ